jgi:hypothetical protein
MDFQGVEWHTDEIYLPNTFKCQHFLRDFEWAEETNMNLCIFSRFPADFCWQFLKAFEPKHARQSHHLHMELRLMIGPFPIFLKLDLYTRHNGSLSKSYIAS